MQRGWPFRKYNIMNATKKALRLGLGVLNYIYTLLLWRDGILKCRSKQNYVTIFRAH